MSWEILREIAVWVLMLSGGIFAVIGAIGVLRFPDFWSRLHAGSVSESAGLILLLAGMSLHSGFTLVSLKLVLIGVFIFITGSTSTHAVANAAMVSGLKPSSDVDEDKP